MRIGRAVVVELGTWLGASAIAMARSVQRWDGTVTCVDRWTGDLEDEGGARDGLAVDDWVVCARDGRGGHQCLGAADSGVDDGRGEDVAAPD